MNREDRIREARRRAAASASQRREAERAAAASLHGHVTRLGPEEAQREVTAAQRSDGATYIGPVKTPDEWRRAGRIARNVTIEAARNRHTITYAELKLAVYETLGMLVGWSMFAELAMGVNRKADGVLLSSIIVHKDDGQPGDGFRPYALSQGFDDPVPTLQRLVFDHFASLEADD